MKKVYGLSLEICLTIYFILAVWLWIQTKTINTLKLITLRNTIILETSINYILRKPVPPHLHERLEQHPVKREIHGREK